MQAQIGRRRDQTDQHRLHRPDAEQGQEADHDRGADIGQEIEQRGKAAPHHGRLHPQGPGAEPRDDAHADIDPAYRQYIGGDAILHLAQDPRGLDAGAEGTASEQELLPQPDARLDHEKGHQEGQDGLDHHARRREGEFFQQAGRRHHDLARFLAGHEFGELLVDLRDPAELVAQVREAGARSVDHGGETVEQDCRGLQDQGKREDQHAEKDKQRDEGCEHVGKPPRRQPVGQRGQDDREDQCRGHGQEHDRPDRQDEGQGEEKTKADEHDQRRNQPQFLFREAHPPPDAWRAFRQGGILRPFDRSGICVAHVGSR